jgi:hypothetical protein
LVAIIFLALLLLLLILPFFLFCVFLWNRELLHCHRFTSFYNKFYT